MTTATVTVNGVNYTIPSDKVVHIISLLQAYRVTESQQQVREVLTNQPFTDGRTLING
jgi:hypothetical protein